MKLFYLLLALTLTLFGCLRHKDNPESYAYMTGNDYPAYGGNKANNRYSPLTQIRLENVKDLKPVWQYFANDPQDTSGGKMIRANEIQCQPIVIRGKLYGTSGELSLFSLDAATGKELWKFRPFKKSRSLNVNRGVMYWEQGNDHRIYYSAGPYLYCVNADDGKHITTFGDQGTIDLHEGLKEGIGHEVQNLQVNATSPGVIYKNTIIMGSSVSEGGDAAPGHIRAWDALTGKLKWVFHTIPLPGEPGYETWPPDAYKKIGGVNNWSGMSLDEKRGVVYLGTGSPSSDFYGGDREGANLYSNCILAIDAETGKLKWHFQTIHHDLWDRDFPCPPNLMTITKDNKRIDVLVAAGKDGNIWVLDRDSGESIYPWEEKPVPTNGLKGEHPFPSQRYPSKPHALNPQIFTENDITNISAEAHDFVLKRFKTMSKADNPYTPPNEQGTILFGYSGGAEWGGNASDTNGIFYQSANIAPWELKMIDKFTRTKELSTLTKGNALFARNCAPCHGVDRKGSGNAVPSLIDIQKRRSANDIHTLVALGNGRMPSFPYISASDRNAIIDFLFNREDKSGMSNEHKVADTITKKISEFPYDPLYVNKIWQYFTDQNGYPAIRPPWGTFNAIDINTGEYKWTIPLGEFPELTAKGIPVTGTSSYGGPVVTASGLIFIASTRDEKIRAIDKSDGKVVWDYKLPAGGFATPITYEVNGKQYVAIAAGGARGAKAGGWYIAFALK